MGLAGERQKDIKADRLIKKYLNRRKFLREYNEAATTTEDDAIMGFLGTSEQPVPGGLLPALSESMLLMEEQAAYWATVETQPYWCLYYGVRSLRVKPGTSIAT
jgi:hypothetical protein